MDPNTIEPILGRTHTDLFKTRNRVRNLGGKGGISLTKFSPDGYSWYQIGALVGALFIWSAPLLGLGVPAFGMGGLTALIVFGPPFALAWASDKTLPNNKTIAEWVQTLIRHAFFEKRLYVAGKPQTPVKLTTAALVWTPDKDGLHV